MLVTFSKSSGSKLSGKLRSYGSQHSMGKGILGSVRDVVIINVKNMYLVMFMSCAVFFGI